MSSVEETFRADCVSWKGYKPCAVQAADKRPDCFGCEQYEAGPAVYDIAYEPFTPEVLSEAETLGIIEMGGLGSVLRTTAVSRAIRDINPDVQISWFTHHRGAELLQYVPGVEAVDIESTDRDGQAALIASLDTVINFELADAAKRLVAQAKRVGGYALNAQGNFHGVYPYTEYFQRLQIDDRFRERNTLTMQQILLRSIGLEDHQAQYDVALSGTNHCEAERVLAQAYEGERPDALIGLNIGTSEKGRLRRWPAERHAALAEMLARSHPDKGVVILSGPEDDATRAQVVSYLGAKLPGNLAILPNDLKVGDFMGVLSKLRVVVTSDTFGMHASRSQDIPTVALAGPMPHRELELTPKDALIGPMAACSPCYHRCSRPVEGHCMQDIGVELVAEQVRGILADPLAAIPRQENRLASLLIS